MDREYGRVQEGPADDGAARRRPESRSLRPHPLGGWANDFARGAAAGRPQCVSPGTTGDAAEKHRNLSFPLCTSVLPVVQAFFNHREHRGAQGIIIKLESPNVPRAPAAS